MQSFVDDLDRSEEKHRLEKFSDFRKILGRVQQHPNRRYFILKSIIINNLYGVDIMEEAVEICKLRLFLKLVAQVERVDDIEPLPDVDFNIRAGNTLVGFTSLEDVKTAITRDPSGQLKLMDTKSQAALKRIEESAEIADRAFHKFHEMQTEHGMDAKEFAGAKQELRRRLDTLGEELDRYLAREYGVNVGANGRSPAFAKWCTSHQPFHWFVEFYGIMKDGGFDVTIGNPPYLERAKLGGLYTPRKMRTSSCRDIYAWAVERILSFQKIHTRLGLIVPVSIVSSDSFDSLRGVVWESPSITWLSHFANRPGQLFDGAQNRLTILLYTSGLEKSSVLSTRYHRWDAKRRERDALFALLRYTALGALARSFHGLLPKVGAPEATSILRKLQSPQTLAKKLRAGSKYPVFWVRVPGYFCQFFLTPPMATPEHGGPARVRGEVNSIFLPDESWQRVTHALLNSSTYYQFFCTYTDGRHINPSDVREFPVNMDAFAPDVIKSLSDLSTRLEQSMKANISLWRKSGLLIESVDSRPTKPIIDEIDHVLARHYGFTDAELDFIINYDIKYRMGREVNEEEGE